MHTPHRHFVAVPLVACVLLGIAGADHALRASATDGDSAMHAASGGAHAVTGIPFAGSGSVVAEGDGLLVESGSYLLVSQAYGHARTSHADAHWFGGVIAMIATPARTTVVALDTAALVFVDGRQTMLPSGMQLMIARDTEPAMVAVPEIWVKEMLEKAERRVSDGFQTVAPMGDVATREDAYALLTALPLRGLHDGEVQRALLAARIMLPGTSLSELLALKLSAERQHPSAQSIVFDVLRDRSLAGTWALALKKASQQSGSAASPEHADAWLELAKRAAADHPQSGCEGGEGVDRLIEKLDNAGYPESADAWRRALKDFTTYCASFSATDMWNAHAERELSIPEEAHEEASVVVYDERESEAAARAAAVAARLLITVEATFASEPPSHRVVRVSGVLAPDGSELTFVYNVESGLAERITRGGRALPNAVPVGALGNR